MSHAQHAEQLSAMLDGELSPAALASLTLHIAACAACAQRLAELAALRAALQEEFPETDVTPEFYEKIARLLDDARHPAAPLPFRPRPMRRPLAWLAGSGAIAATLVVLLMPHHDVTKDLMSVRDAALRGSISQEVAVNQAAPMIAGFRLTAARSDLVAGHPATVLDYAKKNQTITLCIWAAHGEPAHGVRTAGYKGMTISYWNDGRQEYWAATTGIPAALDDFVAALRRA